MKYTLFLILLIVFSSCKERSVDVILPDWKPGESRIIEESISYFTIYKGDTIVDMKGNSKSKFTVADKIGDIYFIEIQTISIPNLNVNADETLLNEEVLNTFKLINNFPEFLMPYKAAISADGEFLEILNLDSVIEEQIAKIKKLQDSLRIGSTVSLAQNNLNSNEEFRALYKSQLIEIVQENLDYFKIRIPTDSIVQPYHVNENYSCHTITNYNLTDTLGLNNKIFEITSQTRLLENDSDNGDLSLDLLFPNRDYIKSILDQSYMKLYWNSESTWLESSIEKVYFYSDSLEYSVEKRRVFLK